jgi:predicted ATP-dependent endonuclease of OLD family
MYIYKIIIKNFRSIESLVWEPNPKVNVLIGGNGSGKSTIGTALHYLLSPNINWNMNRLTEVDFFNRDLSREIFIEVYFKGVEDFLVDDADLMFEHIDEEGHVSLDGEELALIVRMACDKSLRPIHSIISNGQEKPFRTSHKQAVQYRFVETERDPYKELSFTNNSILTKMFSDEKISDAITVLVSEFEILAQSLLYKEPEFIKAIKDLRDKFSSFNLTVFFHFYLLR